MINPDRYSPNTKNASPRRLAFIAAIIASFIVVIAEYLTSVSGFFTKNWMSMGVVFGITFISTFLIFSYLLELFIYRKIKLIYKTINRFKDSKESTLKKIDLNEDIIGNVSKEVIEWQKDRSDEIEELKKMETFRKEFLGNVSHELKTPIFSIQGYIHTLLEGGIDDPEVNIHYLQRAARSVDRLCLIVDDLEEISKLESGELLLDQRTFDISELVKDAFDSLELRARERKIKLVFKEGSNATFFVYGDKERIRQVIVNLLVNSIKYGKENGTTQVGLYDMDENILIEITDNGLGIEPEHLPRLFERFYRVDKSRSRDQGGTGLGLAIVKHILEAHKQSINVRSTYGIGTTFTFTLKKSK
jgi:two-component system, OmpR family, phosphate regulon sensor histidine kinase PhoR